ncbi:MAG: class I SAM-dependent methyltransferase [Lentisphaerae bacterium]|nr:class I SAM-dependent methyltransferase [Lentisphaerota bacterium]
MQVGAAFYERLHAQGAEYGRNRYDVARLIAAPAFQSWLRRVDKLQLRSLDVGCGKGQFLFDLVQTLRDRHGANFSYIAVVDLVKVVKGSLLDSVSPAPEFFQQSVDGQELPFVDAQFDFVSCNHVLEHVFQTEHLLREIRRITKPDGLVVISVPNCAALINRLCFLVGGQPLGSEVGTESITYGFWPRFLQNRLQPYDPSGHIRDFTPRGLSDLARACGFRPAGWWAQHGGMVATWMRNIGILLEPQSP